MRLKVQTRPGKIDTIYVSACSWPRSRYAGKGLNGALRRCCTTLEQRLADIQEVKEYLSRNPEATIFDVALEFHHSDAAAYRIMREARR